MFTTTIKDRPIISVEVTQEYLDLITPLQYLDNKDHFTNPLSAPRIPNGILILLPSIEKDQCKYFITKDGKYLSVTLPNGKNKLVRSCHYGINSNNVCEIAFDNKPITSELLIHYGIPTTYDLVLDSPTDNRSASQLIQEALDYGAQMSFPLICKPIDALEWRGVFKIFNREQLAQFLNEYYGQQFTYRYMIQNFIEGKDYRVIYYKGKVWIAYERTIPNVIGDWVQTLQQLIEPTTAYWVNSEEVQNYIALQWLESDYTPSVGESINITPTANVSKGGTTRLITHEIDDRDLVFLDRVAQAMWAEYFGIDIISTGAIADGVVLEINKQPWVSGVSGAPKTMWINYEIGKKTWEAIKESEGII